MQKKSASNVFGVTVLSLSLTACVGGGGGGTTLAPTTVNANTVTVASGGASTAPAVFAQDTTPVTAAGVAYPAYLTVARMANTDTTAVKATLTNNVAAGFDVTLSGSIDGNSFSERFTQSDVQVVLSDGVAAQKMGSDGNTYGLMMAGSDLSYARYGYWERDNGNDTFEASELGAVVYGGRETHVANMPVAGTAVYSGLTRGVGLDAAGNVDGLLGNISLTANFGTAAITGDITNIVNSANTPIDAKAALAGSIAGNGFSGTLQATNLAGTTTLGNGQFDGKFFGPAAQEVAGKWNYNGNDGIKVIGAFGAKQAQ